MNFSNLRKHPFVLALRRWGRFARRNETSPAAKSEDKRMFSQPLEFSSFKCNSGKRFFKPRYVMNSVDIVSTLLVKILCLVLWLMNPISVSIFPMPDKSFED